MALDSTPYVYYGQTTALCETCLQLIPAKILFEDDAVYHLKRCPEHGAQKTRVAADIDFFHQSKQLIKPGDKPLTRQTEIVHGCPHDCGLCPDHEQHSCVALIEINDACAWNCPVCFADASPSKRTHLPLAQVEAMIDALIDSEGEPDVVQITGGEPTEHPNILEILRLAKRKPIRHLMLNTNGARIAGDADFVAQLAELRPGFEVYLQFDAVSPAAVAALRGSDVTDVRQRALENLEHAGISTTLVATVKNGVNSDELGAIIDHALSWRCVRGVTFQPIQDAGRNPNFDKQRDRMLLGDIRNGIAQQSRHFEKADIIPLPCNPEGIAIAYGLRNGDELVPVTRMIPLQELVAAAPNSISFEKNAELRARLMQTCSLSSEELNAAERMESLLCCLPRIPAPENLGYADIFRIAIVQFLDRYNFCLGAVKRSCIHFVTPDLKIVPFDTYNLFHRQPLTPGNA
ncbi:radical SAM protein [Magnetofaba australis]|uniref:Putative radical SAM superfamily protein n=1 Tax=Magnetofaba australis IT-1 TaxID=1434232 RepID=A0A1Y2K768_9PROT|nr:radical SAM protein [Magnetofaba australis]OSM04202.1 putative radical SAM superfamily protein [Magnetofaba australis IT-1]